MIVDDDGYVRLFDEFMGEDEFGLALGVVKDFFADHPESIVTLSTSKNIEELEAAMVDEEAD